MCRSCRHQLRDPSLIPPVFEFDHNIGFRAVIGGYVYRGGALPELQGTYVFSFPEGLELWGLKKQGSAYAQFKVMDLPASPGVHSFSEDNAGELYLISSTAGSTTKGRIRKLVPAPGTGTRRLDDPDPAVGDRMRRSRRSEQAGAGDDPL